MQMFLTKEQDLAEQIKRLQKELEEAKKVATDTVNLLVLPILESLPASSSTVIS